MIAHSSSPAFSSESENRHAITLSYTQPCRFVLPILLLSNILAKLAFRREQPAIYYLKSFIVLRLGQRVLPQLLLKQISRAHFSTAPRTLTSPASHNTSESRACGFGSNFKFEIAPASSQYFGRVMLGTRAVPNAFPVVNSYHVPYSFSFAREPIRTVSPRQPKKKKSQPTKRKRQKSARRQTGKLFEDLVAVQARLRAPGGCPWDREQTHATLKTYLIEEAYEVLDALENGDPRELKEELGDLLLQVLFHADLGARSGLFRHFRRHHRHPRQNGPQAPARIRRCEGRSHIERSLEKLGAN